MSGALRQFSARKPVAAAAVGPPEPAASHTTWWADDLALADAAEVASWTPRHDDLSYGNLAQATAARRPIYRTSPAYLNNRPSIEADGVDDYLDTGLPAVTLSQPNTIVFVGGFRATGANKMLVHGTGANSHVLFASGSTGFKWSIYAGATGYVTGTNSDTVKRLFVAIYNGASSRIELNGTSTSTGNVGTGTLDAVRLFADSSLGSIYHGDAVLSMLQVIDGTLTAGELSDLETWVADYYGLTIS